MSTKQTVLITPPNVGNAVFDILGMAPYVQLKFSGKTKDILRQKMEEGPTARKGKLREPRDFDADYKSALHRSLEGWHGIPANAFRQALVSACRLVGFQMTKAKLALFIIPDGFDEEDGTPLIKINGEPEMVVHNVRNDSGVVDLRVRGMWREWSATLKISYDADMFSLTDVTNLLLRAGNQVGIGEGRPDSRKSSGMGWGLFSIKNEKDSAAEGEQ